jgi:hypothetical protein
MQNAPKKAWRQNLQSLIIYGAVPDNAGMCYWIGDEEESIKQGEAG